MEIRMNFETKFVSKFIPISMNTSYGMSIPLFCFSQKGERKQFPFDGLFVSCQKKLSKNIIDQIPEGGCKDFHLLAQRRVAPELWL